MRDKYEGVIIQRHSTLVNRMTRTDLIGVSLWRARESWLYCGVRVVLGFISISCIFLWYEPRGIRCSEEGALLLESLEGLASMNDVLTLTFGLGRQLALWIFKYVVVMLRLLVH